MTVYRSKSFEYKLTYHEFSLTDETPWDKCPHINNDPDQTIFVRYYQSCYCCEGTYYTKPIWYDRHSKYPTYIKHIRNIISKDLIWFRDIGCEDCIYPILEIQKLGGHYSNYRLFKISDVTIEDVTTQYGFSKWRLDPNETFQCE